MLLWKACSSAHYWAREGEIDVVCIYEIENSKIAKGDSRRASPECTSSPSRSTAQQAPFARPANP
ncbi:hypothetical protein AGR4A_pAt10127 [Agrobacterium tumefaciens str. B6]|uniref:Uncharacterized protein n=1 Tax=Agrobacterium tumefaciens str. B6 TaxID=1183423 RepID=A0A822V5J0_AGRTU|nr:hypothetical protein AGR4A_pAt10127 [Agrobacterium tumefaciens str. B6]